MGNAFNLAHSSAFIQSLKCFTATVYILHVSGVIRLTRANLTGRPRSLRIHAGQSLGGQLLCLHPAVTAATGLVALMGSSWSPIHNYLAYIGLMGIGQLHLR